MAKLLITLGVVNLSTCPVLLTDDLSGLQHKDLGSRAPQSRSFWAAQPPIKEHFFLTGPERRLAFCFGPAPCPSRSAAEAAVPPACPRRGKRERGRIKIPCAAGQSLTPLALP